MLSRRVLPGRLSTVRRATLGSIIGGFLSQAALVVSGILGARLLGPTDRGYLALLVALPSIVCQVGGLGLSLAVTYYLASGRSSVAHIFRLIRGPALIQIVVLTVVHAGLLLALTRGKPHYVLVAGLITLGQVTATLTLEYAYALLQGQLRYTPFNTLRVVQPSLYTLILGVAVVLGVGTLQGVAAVTVGATFVSAALTAWMARPRTSVEPRQDDLELRDVVKFGTQGYLGYVSPIEAFRLDQLVVGLGLSPAALGYYVVGAAFTNLPRTLAHSIGLIAAPHIASQTEIGDRRRTVVRFGALSAVLLATIVIALIVAVGLLLPFLFGHRYSSAVPIARLLLAGSFFLAMKRVLTDALRGAGEASAGAKAEIVTVVTFGVAAAALAPRFGAEGVAAAFGLATAAGCAALLRLLRRTPLFQEAGAPA